MRNFAYRQPERLKQLRDVYREFPSSVAMAGGTDLLDLLKSEILAPAHVVDLKRLTDDELRRLEERGDRLHVGAMVTLAELVASPLLTRRYPALQQAAASAATPQLRHVGTLGGNLCQRPRCWYYRDPDLECLRRGGSDCYAVEGRNRFHAVIGGGPCYIVHPSDTAVALLALGADLVVWRDGKTRTVPMASFYVLPDDDPERETILQPGELVLGVEVPRAAAGLASSYTKFKFREGWDFAVVSVAVVKGGGRHAVALGGVAPVPWYDAAASAALARGATAEEVAAAALADADPLEENAYKVPLARNLVRQALEELG